MAQTKNKRRRKRRGTQGGSVAKGSNRRPRTREEAKAQARRRSTQKRATPAERVPSWQGSINRALIGAVVFFAIVVLLFGRGVGEAFALAAVMCVIYVPLGYYMDRFFFRRRRAAQLRARQKEQQQKGR